jgi:aryl-alcohol dehydrogenase-like predicted oxidoreductase
MTVETRQIAQDYSISRIIRGGWQLAGGHGEIDRETAIDDLIAAFDAGVTTFDCADIYTGVEGLYGAMRERIVATRGADAGKALHVHTKLVPDLELLGKLKKRDIEATVDRSLSRLKMDRLDVVQFHWWDYQQPGWLEAIGWLNDLRSSGKVRLVSGTNFDTAHIREILHAGIPLSSLQVQYSLLDRRPEHGLAELCNAHSVALLCYGAVAGGFLSDRWLNAPEPKAPLANRSLTKYKLIIDDFGGWGLFQELLAALRRVANRYDTDIASVACRLTLDFPGVAAVIVGATSRAHLTQNVRAAALALTLDDKAEVEAVAARRLGPIGDVYELERDRNGRHGSIMKYNLNAEKV